MKNRLQSVLLKIEDIDFFIEQKNSVDDEILEIVLRIHIPKLKSQIIKLLNYK